MTQKPSATPPSAPNATQQSRKRDGCNCFGTGLGCFAILIFAATALIGPSVLWLFINAPVAIMQVVHGEFKYEVDKTRDAVVITRTRNGQFHYEFPSTVHEKPVVAIGEDDDTFSYSNSYNYEGACQGSTFKTVVVPEGVELIGDYVFKECRKLRSVTLPESLKTIGDCAFAECESLTDLRVPESVEKIDPRAFRNCKELNLADAFRDNPRFGALPLTPPADKQKTDGYLWYEKTDAGVRIRGVVLKSLSSLTIPDTIEGLPVMELAPLALYDSPFISLTLPESLETIGPAALKESRRLEKINLPAGLKKVDESAFSYCSNLVLPEFPQGLTSFGSNAFEGCRLPETLRIPDGTTSIPREAFHLCRGSTSVEFPQTLVSIDAVAFCFCDSLTRVKLPPNVKSLGEGAFYGCHGLEVVELSEGLETIGRGAFNNCDSLTQVHIPSSVKSLGTHAFYSCKALEVVELPEGLEINDQFDECPRLEIRRYRPEQDRE